jgi:DNA-binding response OmpR family regulator
MTGKEVSSPKLRVLLVEDHPDTAGTLATLMRLRGHEVEVAPDGPTALRLAADSPPDVALLDIGLPGGMDGCDVARHLGGGAAGKKPLLIGVTGNGCEADRHRSAEAGIHLYLRKPVDAEALSGILERFKAVQVG